MKILLRLAALAIGALIVIQPSSPTFGQQYQPLAATTLSASTTSSRVALPAGASGNNITIQNVGTVEAFVTFGGSTVGADTTGESVPGPAARCFTVPGATYVAAVTASGTTTLRISQGNGPCSLSFRGGSGGGSSTLTAGSTATSGFAAGQYVYSDGSLAQAGTFGTGVQTAIGLTLNGSGAVSATTSPVFVTPTLGAATGTSLTLNKTISGSSTTAPFAFGTLGYSDTNTFSAFQTSVNSYAQSIWQNTSAGATASTDLVVSNNLGTASTYYGNFGINSSGFTGSGALNAANSTYLTATSGDLAIGTTTANAIHLLTNGATTDAITISSGGNVSINGATPGANALAVTGPVNFNATVIANSAVATDNSTNFLKAVGTLPASPSVDTQGVLFDITSAGSAAHNPSAMRVVLESGYTGNQQTRAAIFENYVAGAGTLPFTSAAANYAFYGFMGATTTGNNVGAIGQANSSSTLNVGFFGRANETTNSPSKNVGAIALAAGGSTSNIGGFFGNFTNASAPTISGNASLVADNGATGYNILDLRNSGTSVLVVTSAGTISLTSAAQYNWNGDAILTRAGAATIQHGAAASSSAAVAQTLQAQGSSGGSLTGPTFTISGSNQTGTTSIGGDLLLTGGTGTSSNGYVRFGTVAANVAVTAAGTIAIKDAGGTLRYLMYTNTP